MDIKNEVLFTSKQNDEDYDDFEKRLEEFIKDADNFNLDDNGTSYGNDNDDENDDFDFNFDDEESSNSQESDDEDDTEKEMKKRIRANIHEDTSDWTDEDWEEAAWEAMTDEELDQLYPTNEFEQNTSLSMKVEILKPSKNPQEELNKLVGCEELKQRMEELVALTQFNKKMRRAYPDKKRHQISLHSIFYGRPGTGKTTVCRIFGGLLKKAGILRLGHVVVCDRGTFIGTLWGDEERSVTSVLEKAKDGVLMIDEAYTLYGENEKDPGRNVLQQMMTTLADESKRNMAVVLCGYKEPMQKMLDSNPGLESRFPNRFEFKDFTLNQLLEITQLRVKEYGYSFSKAGWARYKEVLMMAYKTRDEEKWGNARFVANQLERIYLQHAVRCMKQNVSKRSMLILTEEDIVPIPVARSERRRVGF
jgi:SpoVK/Ycf46/Vps4 family AAA+-type ATPase